MAIESDRSSERIHSLDKRKAQVLAVVTALALETALILLFAKFHEQAAIGFIAIVALAFFLVIDITDFLVLFLALFLPLVTQLSTRVGGVINFDWWDAVILLIVLHRVVRIGFRLFTGETRWRISFIGIALGLYVLSFVTSLVHSEYPTQTLVALAKSIMSYGLFWYLLFRIRNVGFVSRFSTAMLFAGAVVAVIAFLQQAFGLGVTLTEFYTMAYGRVEQVRRVGVYGTFLESLLLGAYLGWILPIAVSLVFVRNQSRLRYIVLGTLSVLLLLSLVFTQSRGAYMMGAVSLLVLAHLRRRDIVRFMHRRVSLVYSPLIMIITVVALIGTVIIFPSIIDRVVSAIIVFIPGADIRRSDLLLYGANSSLGRLEAMETSLKLFLKYPLFGSGAGTYELVTKQAWAHNTYLHVLAERGLFGLLAYIALLVAMGRSLLRWSRQCTEPYWQALSAGVLAAFIGVITGGTFNSAETVVQVAFYLWFYTKVAHEWSRVNAYRPAH